MLRFGQSNLGGNLLGVSRQVFLIPKHENKEGMGLLFPLCVVMLYLYVITGDMRGSRMRSKATLRMAEWKEGKVYSSSLT